ncbi:50S ribosomal protein L21 [Candidatus Gottesmanbacteria bacterium RIFCSPHIGHO2_02_FULL_40_24]|uniref:Large ribosomal subunit protein bL21 n=1 Tax=Candidatus Gottesmanbacteria bacterium RIFCSPHIGHO2_01_FULL_40_15 TaxID=1798376 RepID=A0A1F5Z2X9_9BACT|nr:MAG: 50S ribosomal protein L21 [Candidatus Gottesmanbacteria bacterium RIFCSPHIGHO2_01_FULL_40_15]OGG16765.1 MAG: 50S ribosomal protein L21 [Candidatus Gottesmanbacteria bacterium RIFCSPHIGHO2_02_FULL_40_24]OGG23235.1 MAG: 50S ribosomal protein L21 [Candidatus Gottesmanbacteria bacterium RIFCSPLOWO2_01_FULL_40_10]
MKYAVVKSGGKQYVVSEGNTVTIDKVDGEVGKNYRFDEVMLLRNEEVVLIGTPFLENVQVSGKVEKQYQGKKLHVMKFKAKVNYRRKIGFRPQLTDISVEKISSEREAAKIKTKTKPVKKAVSKKTKSSVKNS